MPPAEKQWIFTKMVGGALALVTLLSIGIGTANIIFDMKRDISRVDSSLIDHKNLDEKKWDSVSTKLDMATTKIYSLETSVAVNQANYRSIEASLAEIKSMLKTFEVVK